MCRYIVSTSWDKTIRILSDRDANEGLDARQPIETTRRKEDDGINEEKAVTKKAEKSTKHENQSSKKDKQMRKSGSDNRPDIKVSCYHKQQCIAATGDSSGKISIIDIRSLKWSLSIPISDTIPDEGHKGVSIHFLTSILNK